MKKVYNKISALLLLVGFFSCDSGEITCEPTTTIQSCKNSLLIMRSELNPATQTTFTLDGIQKTITTPLVFNNIQSDVQPNFFSLATRPSNYDAYNKINNTYFIEFPIEQRLYKYDISSQTRQELIVVGFYAAPIFNNGTLYTISVENNGYATNPANYSIQTINQSTGALTSLVSGSFSLTSSFNWESMSSATDNDENIYFVSGTNLIKYNINTNSSQHIQLTPNFNFTDNFERYYGLELRNNGNLLAIRSRDNEQGEGLELVEINATNQMVVVVYDFMANGITINAEFYATTYDPCDDTYYITSRNDDDFNTSSFYEINVPSSTIKMQSTPFYLMGIQSKF